MTEPTPTNGHATDPFTSEAKPMSEDGGQVKPLDGIGKLLATMPERWENPVRPVSTGFNGLDTLLHGGLRPGDMIGLAGEAKAGKSALFGQLLINAVKRGATGLYVTIEMPPFDVASRYIAGELYKSGEHDAGKPFSWRSVADGHAYKRNPGAVVNALAALAKLPLHIERPQELLTPSGLRELVKRAKVDRPDAPLVVLVDPLQRMYADKLDDKYGRVDVNGSDVMRLDAVARELKRIADEEQVSVLFTSDTTKENVKGEQNEMAKLGFRGTYTINHWATALLGMVSDTDADKLRQRVKRDDLDLPECTDATRFALVSAGGVRDSAGDTDCALAFVGAAATFIESEQGHDDLDRFG